MRAGRSPSEDFVFDARRAEASVLSYRFVFDPPCPEQTPEPVMYTPRQRKANNALGIGLVALVFLMESSFAHHKHPSPASPYVWAALGIVAAAAFVYYLRHRRPDGES